MTTPVNINGCWWCRVDPSCSARVYYANLESGEVAWKPPDTVLNFWKEQISALRERQKRRKKSSFTLILSFFIRKSRRGEGNPKVKSSNRQIVK